MRHILVPVDGSGNSLRALTHAAGQGKSGAITLHLLNVEPFIDDYGMVAAYLPRQQHIKNMKLRAERILKRCIAHARARNVVCRTHIAMGDVAGVIVKTARRLKCDSIIMGTRGMGPLKDLMMGSVASKVLHLARVPVTLVK